jgi:hypothetical protein
MLKIFNQLKGDKTMKISFNDQFLDLKGYPLPQKMDDVLANELALSSIGDPVKMMALAMDLSNDGEIEVAEKEITFLKDFILHNIRLTNLAKSQLFERIEKQGG